MKDLSNSNAAKNRLCCSCGKYCLVEEVYFPERLMCLDCDRLQETRAKKRYFIVPIAIWKAM